LGYFDEGGSQDYDRVVNVQPSQFNYVLLRAWEQPQTNHSV